MSEFSAWLAMHKHTAAQLPAGAVPGDGYVADEAKSPG